MTSLSYKKTTTYFREDLYKKLKILSATEGKELKEIYNKAIENYFNSIEKKK